VILLKSPLILNYSGYASTGTIGKIVGGTYSYGVGGRDFWVIKLNSQGNKLWDKTFGGSGDDEANSIIQNADDGYAVAGYTSSKGAGGKDTWVIKLDEQGNLKQ
jgi:predicted secreted protein